MTEHYKALVHRLLDTRLCVRFSKKTRTLNTIDGAKSETWGWSGSGLDHAARRETADGTEREKG